MLRDLPSGVQHRAPNRAPCKACPYRTDAPSGLWHHSEYSKLALFDQAMHEQPAGVFACHEDPDAYRLCAGWVGTHDMMNNLGLRLAFAAGRMTIDTFMACVNYVSPVPLFKSGREAAVHGLQEYLNPSAKVAKVQDRLKRKRAGSSSEIVDG